jgi:hypothetical protein
MTFWYKRVFPFVLLGLVLVFAILPVAASDAPQLPFVLVPIIMIGIGYFLMKRLIFDMVDEVWDAGDALIVRNKDQEDRIPLSSIMNVNYSPLVNPPRVTLKLRTPSVFGDAVTFCAPVRFMPFAPSPIVDDLVRRVDAARLHAR